MKIRFRLSSALSPSPNFPNSNSLPHFLASLSLEVWSEERALSEFKTLAAPKKWVPNTQSPPPFHTSNRKR